MINKYLFPFLVAHQINKKLENNLKFRTTEELNSKWESLLRDKYRIYDATLLKIKNSNTGTNFSQVNEIWREGLRKEAISNHIVNEIQSEIEQNTTQGIENKWRELLQDKTPDTVIQIITNNMYTDHSNALSNIERKASSLLVAVGFSISLMSIFAGFIWDSTNIPSNIFYLFFIFSSLSIINMIFTAFSAWYGIKVSTRNYSTVGDFENTVNKTNWQIEWSIKQLTNLELNNTRWTIKGHWVNVGQIHFIYGIITIALGFFTLLFGYIFTKWFIH